MLITKKLKGKNYEKDKRIYKKRQSKGGWSNHLARRRERHNELLAELNLILVLRSYFRDERKG
jgi:hypothetical protein